MTDDPLTMEQAMDMASAVGYRQFSFPDEPVTYSVMVVLLNFGDRFAAVQCVAGEWSGTKADLEPRQGVPLCPNGHPLVQGRGKRLAWIEEPTHG